MTPKRTYINLINDFWERFSQEPISVPASMVYFYLLNRINRNRWQPVFISDHDLAAEARIARRALPSYKAEIAAAGLLYIETKGTGRNGGTFYQIPSEETAQKGTVNGANLRQSVKRNSAKKSHLSEETAQKGTVNGANLRQLTPDTPINISYKTSLRPSTTTEDMRAGARVNVADVVEVEAVEVEILKSEEGEIADAAARLSEKKRRAAAEGEQVLKAFFDQSNAITLETLCMQNHLSLEQLQGVAGRIIADWTQDGTCHDDYKGNFDIRDAIKHLRLTIPKKAAAEARGEAAPKTREQSRQDLMAGAYANLQRVMNGGQTTKTEEPF